MIRDPHSIRYLIATGPKHQVSSWRRATSCASGVIHTFSHRTPSHRTPSHRIPNEPGPVMPGPVMQWKVIIAGSRTITDLRHVEAAVAASGWRDRIGTVVSGRAPGVDTLGEIWARSAMIPVDPHPAEWDRYGLSAGYYRNLDMARVSDALIAVWDRSSRGTKHIISVMRKMGKPVYVHEVRADRDATGAQEVREVRHGKR